MQTAMMVEPYANPSSNPSSMDILRYVLPYVSDENGVFRTTEAKHYLVKEHGYTEGTANSAIFHASDPTERVGYRRFRRIGARSSSASPSEAAFRNDMSGKQEIPGWKRLPPPVTRLAGRRPVNMPVSREAVENIIANGRDQPRTIQSRRTPEEVDKEWITLVARELTEDGTFYRDVAMAGQPVTYSPTFHRKVDRYATKLVPGSYRLNAEGLVLLRRYYPELASNIEQVPGGVEMEQKPGAIEPGEHQVGGMSDQPQAQVEETDMRHEDPIATAQASYERVMERVATDVGERIVEAVKVGINSALTMRPEPQPVRVEPPLPPPASYEMKGIDFASPVFWFALMAWLLSLIAIVVSL